MAGFDGFYSRPDKLDDVQTVLYEIDMVRWAKDRLLASNRSSDERDVWAYLENFLLHYRNLIEFFGKLGDDPTDLSVGRPEVFWRADLPQKKDLEFMTKQDLWQKYDTRSNPEAISKYLHHCTTHRTIKKRWPVEAMFDELSPVIDKFESLLPGYKRAPELSSTRGLSAGEGNSTTSTRVVQHPLDK